MKANAPEKLYIDVSDNLSDSFLYGFTEKRKEDDIEYTRTDAFIEKAATWFADRYQANGSCLCANDIEDFEEYLKK